MDRLTIGVRADRVYVAEGEKAADAARMIGPATITSAHGSQSPEKTDWTPLAGKQVVILPHNHDAGQQCAKAVSTILADLSPAPAVRVVESPELPPANAEDVSPPHVGAD